MMQLFKFLHRKIVPIAGPGLAAQPCLEHFGEAIERTRGANQINGFVGCTCGKHIFKHGNNMLLYLMLFIYKRISFHKYLEKPCHSQRVALLPEYLFIIRKYELCTSAANIHYYRCVIA